MTIARYGACVRIRGKAHKLVRVLESQMALVSPHEIICLCNYAEIYFLCCT